MHNEAYAWFEKYATQDSVTVLDLGGRDVNGSVRPLWPNATRYVVIDILEGPNVDIVADAATWEPNESFDVVVCAETFEHTPVWQEICGTAYKACRDGGVFIATMAGPGRGAHSAIDGGPIRTFEYYGNVNPDRLRNCLESQGWKDITVDQQFNPCDVRTVAIK